jgi:hypothetical protein
MPFDFKEKFCRSGNFSLSGTIWYRQAISRIPCRNSPTDEVEETAVSIATAPPKRDVTRWRSQAFEGTQTMAKAVNR